MDVSRRVNRHQGQNVMCVRMPGPEKISWWMTHSGVMCTCFFVRDRMFGEVMNNSVILVAKWEGVVRAWHASQWRETHALRSVATQRLGHETIVV
jgi:hypothetical protein